MPHHCLVLLLGEDRGSSTSTGLPGDAGRSWSINGVCEIESASLPKFLLLFISQLLALSLSFLTPWCLSQGGFPILTSPPLLLGSYNSGRIDFFPAWVTLDLSHHFRAATRRQAVLGDIECPSHLGSQMCTSQFLCLQVHDLYSSLCIPPMCQ